MLLPVTGLTALRAMRLARSRDGRLFGTPCDLPSPDPSPRRRWTPGIVPLEPLALDAPPSAERTVNVIVRNPRDRIKASFASCVVRSGDVAPLSFLDMGGGVVVPSPELLFVELATVMEPEVHALLGYELCGSFSRDPRNPRTGPIRHGVEPATSVERIANFLETLGGGDAPRTARRTLRRVANNAWSAMESVLALLATSSVAELGYGLGELTLNVRHETDEELIELGVRSSRVPDIEIRGTHVGLNYDGRDHLDLDSVVRAAERGDASEAARAAHEVREKYLDDLRRNRELAARGQIVLPVVAEDLFRPGALDALMLEIALILERFDGVNVEQVRAAMRSPRIVRERQRLIWSLLPWDAGSSYARQIVMKLSGQRSWTQDAVIGT